MLGHLNCSQYMNKIEEKIMNTLIHQLSMRIPKKFKVAALLLVGGYLLLAQAAPKKSDTAPLAKVFVIEAKIEELSEELSYPSTVDSRVNANILASGDGVITELPLTIGAPVTARSVIAKIKKIDPGYEYAPQKITSSVSGFLSAYKVSIGSQVERGSIVAQLTDPKQLKISIEVAPDDRDKIRPGLIGQFITKAHSSPVSVKVIGVSPQMNPLTGTASAELDILGAEKPLPGTVGFVSFKVNVRKGLRVPETAIKYKENAAFVRVIKDNVAKQVPVVLGVKSGGQAEVISGLISGDQVVERASSFVEDGEKVEVVKK